MPLIRAKKIFDESKYPNNSKDKVMWSESFVNLKRESKQTLSKIGSADEITLFCSNEVTKRVGYVIMLRRYIAKVIAYL